LKAFVVYIHTSPNSKYYVGITSKNPKYRWDNGNGYKNNKHFYSAISKYGWDNFQHEIIASNLTKEEAKNFEIILIEKLNSNNRIYGYNNTLGGEGCNGYKPTKETIEILRERSKGNKNRLNKNHSEETKKKISTSHIGKRHSVETIEMMQNQSYNKRSVTQYDKQYNKIQIFDSMREAEDVTGIFGTNISKCCRGILKTTGGYHWNYAD